MFIIETAALTHDIGIHVCEEKYGNCNGKLQEKEGPAIAKKLLEKLGFDKDVSDRVQYLIAHHHTYDNIDGIDYQILVEADELKYVLGVHCFQHSSIIQMYHCCIGTGRHFCH